MMSDSLSSILSAFHCHISVSGELKADGAWAIRFPAPHAIKFGAVVQGTCWHSIGQSGNMIQLEEGDVFIVNGGSPLYLAQDPIRTPVDAVSAFAEGQSAVLGNGQDFHLLGGHVVLDAIGYRLLSESLPPIIHIAANSERARVLSWLLQQLVLESANNHPGSAAAQSPLAHLLFLHALREYLDRGDLTQGWLKAISDPQIAPAMQCLHHTPERNWRIEDLANASGMSRSRFVERFKMISGMAPITYLTFWRMQLAQTALMQGEPSLSALAFRLGYSSESAFSSAFKRTVGLSPAHYRAQNRTE